MSAEEIGGVAKAGTLILVRHGESLWNAEGLFTGWVDVGLSERGEAEAEQAGRLLADAGLLPELLHTSVLSRAIRTAEIALAATGRQWIPVRRSWRLNERHYGALQGLNKEQVRSEHGDEQFKLWRRSYDVPPPPLPADSEQAASRDPRYALLAPDALPATECLQDVLARVLPYWHDAIVPDLRRGSTVMICAHGNSLRALIKHLDGISDGGIAELNVPTGIPLAYRLDEDLAAADPVDPAFGVSGRYLDPEAASGSIAAVRAQGGGASLKR